MGDCYGWFDDFDDYCCLYCPCRYDCFYYTYGYYWDEYDDYEYYY